ncbi:4632_t:CDS:2 [Ambispora leptoticha]|uniref:4632_t:CDS:1 n=1 Tax=Ambispora leptoticha TaxID=144679 RepID=A0A9N9D6A9_9GLOM|nr:4632_t:CDS:2 [Ambispora leptoticha]
MVSTTTSSTTTSQTIRERVLARMHDFTTYQATRVALYKEFEEAFAQNLNTTATTINTTSSTTGSNLTCTDEEFALVCRITTDGFNEVSQDIRAVEQELLNINANEQEEGIDQMVLDETKELATFIRQLQELEREKLKL